MLILFFVVVAENKETRRVPLLFVAKRGQLNIGHKGTFVMGEKKLNH